MAIWAGKAEQPGTMNPYGEDFEFFRYIKPIEAAKQKNSKTS